MRVVGLVVGLFLGVGVEGQCDVSGVLQNLDLYLPATPTVSSSTNMIADGESVDITLSGYSCDSVACNGNVLSPAQPACARGLMGYTLSVSLQESESAIDKTTLLTSFNTMFNPDYEATNPQVISVSSSSSARVDIAPTPTMQFETPSLLRQAIKQKYTDTHQSAGGISTIYTPTSDIILEVIRSHNPCDPASIHNSMKESGHIDLSVSFVNCKAGEMVKPGGRVSCRTLAEGYHCDPATCIGEVGTTQNQWDPPSPRCNIVGEILQFEFYMSLTAPPGDAEIAQLTTSFNEVYGSRYQLMGGAPASAPGNREIRFDVVQAKADQSLDEMKKDIERLYRENSNKFASVSSTRVNAAPGMPLVRSAAGTASPGGDSTAAPSTPSPDDDVDWLPIILAIVGGLVCLILLFLAWRIRRMTKKKEREALYRQKELREFREREMIESTANSSSVSEPRHNFYKALDDFAIPGGRSRQIQPPTPKPVSSALAGGTGSRDLSPFGCGLGRGHIVEKGAA